MSNEIITVLGAGTMGHGIAHVAALAGYETRIYDVAPEVLGVALSRIEGNLEKGVARGKVDPESRDAALGRIEAHPSLEGAVTGATVVIEAAPERMEQKQKLLGQASDLAADGALLATNTSSLSITAIAESVPQPDRVIGMHFFNPVHIMELIEIVCGKGTSDTSVERARAIAECLGKTPIVVKDSPGFASSRLGIALGLEAIRMVEEEVASPEDIDRAMTLGYRHPMGPLRLTDLVGLDIRLGIARYLHESLGSDSFRPPRLLESMVEEGKLGKKTGEGFYRWED
jgi:3-hydroxybutyryl-CoA dehydrogenase